MSYERMSAALQKVAKMQPLSADDEVMWVAAHMACRRTRLKQRIVSVAAIADDTKWPTKDWCKDTHLAVAIILNRHDMLARLGYTILEAMERISPALTSTLISIEAELRSEGHLAGGARP